MCLRNVTTRNPKKTEGVGYKAFKQMEDGLHSRYYDNGDALITNQWLTDSKSGQANAVMGVTYPAGYHIFRYKRDAVGWGSTHAMVHAPAVVRRVRYREALVLGKDESLERPVIVARQIYIEAGS